ncbi:MAG: extracellular solute-binding protein [Chloroflexota bacterium]|nr:extracellular solute-binding protein [Chloroflexota bacterium]
MTTIRPRKRGFLVAAAIAVFLMAVIGCGSEVGPTPAATGAAMPATSAEPASVAAIIPSPEPVPDARDVLELTWWTVPQFSPFGEAKADQLVATQIGQFVSGNPDLSVETVVKAPYGRGGVLDFLLRTQKVAPSLLPDVVSLDADELGIAIRAGLLQPIEEDLIRELLTDLFPFSISAGRQDGLLYALQYEGDIEHIVVDTTQVDAVPRNWMDILDGEHPYFFSPGPSGNPSDAFLVQYQASGGVLGGKNEPFVLDEQALFSVLTFYEHGQERGVIPAEVLDLDNTEEIWPIFDAGQAQVAHVRSSRFLKERRNKTGMAFGTIPAATEQPTNIGRGWTLAVVAQDPERQAASVRFIEAMLASEFNATRSLAADRLPVRRSALDLWDPDDPYVSFVRWQLEAAATHPSGASYLHAAPILSEAARSVLSGDVTAREATEQATGMSVP